MSEKPLDLAILISGRGSNMRALVEACRAPDFPARVEVVISNRPEAKGLDFAGKAGIKTATVDHKAFSDKASFERALQQELSRHNVNFICLAGFMRLLSADFIKHWESQIINIHPSLLPAYKGLNTHERALRDGVSRTGCTVHFVTPEMDEGPVILQREVPVKAGDTPEDLAARVLEQEHIAYPEAVRLIGEREAELVDAKAKIL